MAAGVHALLLMAHAEDAQLQMGGSSANAFLQVLGAEKQEWRFQTSDDLLLWRDAPELGAVYSSATNIRLAGLFDTNVSQRFYRAIQTEGLYDITLLRTISLTFTQSNWQTRLTSGRNTGSNTVCTLVLDNGIAIEGVGARYRGNSSFGGMGGASLKKSINLEIDHTDPEARLMGYKTLNLNNAYMDETLMREPLYFNAMRRYAICPHSSFVKLYINGQYWGVYCDTQQEDGDLIDEYLPSNDGDRFRAPNMPGLGGRGALPGRPGGGGSGVSALSYLGTNLASYKSNYELKSNNSTSAWERLMRATEVLNNTPTNQLRNKVEEVLAVDSWLWFLALENIFTDEDGYYSKGADYGFYYEPESGRFHPVEHDGNESLATGDVSVSPVQGATSTDRPVLRRLLSIPELRQRYLAHLRTALEQTLHPALMTPVIQQYSALTIEAIRADTKKGFTLNAYTNDLRGLLNFVTNRYKFLTNHAELRPLPPEILSVSHPTPAAHEIPFITAEVRPQGTNGISSVWLYHRGKSHGRFAAVQMFDDGQHGDGAARDSLFGARTTPYPAATKVRYYIEARSANAAQAASFAPAQAERITFNYRVALFAATNSAVVINELMASNKKSLADPQGEYDDWIELRNLTDQEVDLSGCYLTDDPANPRKWPFPPGTLLPAYSYLLVWADEDQSAPDGLHASFKLDAQGEQLLFIDTDVNLNAVLDMVSFGPQRADLSYGRRPDQAECFGVMNPTPGTGNP